MFEKGEWQWVVVHLLPRDNSIWLLVRYWKLKGVLLNLDSLSSYSFGTRRNFQWSHHWHPLLSWLGLWLHVVKPQLTQIPTFQSWQQVRCQKKFDSTNFGSCQLDSPPSCVIVVRSSSSIRSPSKSFFISCYLSPLTYFQFCPHIGFFQYQVKQFLQILIYT